jgi:hypothetical protein
VSKKSRQGILNDKYLIRTGTKFQITQIIIFLELFSNRLRKTENIVEENGNWIIKELWSRGVVVAIKFYDILSPYEFKKWNLDILGVNENKCKLILENIKHKYLSSLACPNKTGIYECLRCNLYILKALI